MTAWAYTVCRNEAPIIQYWVRAYRQWCDRVIVYDEASDDGTRELAEAEGAEVREYTASVGMDDFAFVGFARDTYPEARGQADWVAWTDADEIIYHPNILERLEWFKDHGINLPHCNGYTMLSKSLPTGPGQIYEQIRRGIPAAEYSKVAVFSPDLNLDWKPGKHQAEALGRPNAVRDDGADPLKLLHYRWLGEEYFLSRNQRNYSRQDEANLSAGHGKECLPGFTGKFSPAWYVGMTELAQECL